MNRDEVSIFEVVRAGGTTSVLCRACVVECATNGNTTVEALTKLPCGIYQIEATADAEIARSIA